ncbi:MAG: short-chain dehydrogenase [Spirochaetaceae bacterium]|nr:short-chain dehydrogenase [Spirochaetaceae bacterium]|tara:strand:- start:9526 stop:10278 length:753 start_codon:yes stop_codon:yes gene_type:complete
MSHSLENAIAVVTGGAAGIGRETCLKLGRMGARVIVSDIDTHSGEETAALLRTTGVEAHFVAADVGLEEDVKKLAGAAAEHNGGIDVWVSNAGIGGTPKKLHKITTEEWNHMMLLDLTSVFWSHKYAVPHMGKRGRDGSIINVASIAGLGGSPGLGPYAVAKAGVVSLTQTAALEMAKKNVRINAICPGWVETKIIDFAGESVQAEMRKQIPIGRFGTPAEVASLIGYLASPESSFITGSIFRADGGIKT